MIWPFVHDEDSSETLVGCECVGLRGARQPPCSDWAFLCHLGLNDWLAGSWIHYSLSMDGSVCNISQHWWWNLFATAGKFGVVIMPLLSVVCFVGFSGLDYME